MIPVGFDNWLDRQFPDHEDENPYRLPISHRHPYPTYRRKPPKAHPELAAGIVLVGMLAALYIAWRIVRAVFG